MNNGCSGAYPFSEGNALMALTTCEAEGDANTLPTTATSSIPSPTKPTCAGSWPEPPYIWSESYMRPIGGTYVPPDNKITFLEAMPDWRFLLKTTASVIEGSTKIDKEDILFSTGSSARLGVNLTVPLSDCTTTSLLLSRKDFAWNL